MGMSNQPVDVDHMMGYKVLGDTSLGAATALIRIGGVAGAQEVPAWADTCLGFYAHLSPSTLLTAEDTVAWGYIESDDGMSIKPFEFIFSPVSSIVGITASANASKGIFYPMNAPVRPLSKLNVYGQQMSGGA
ncbi:unnamed protein product, partial [marine sediment metagenome]